MGHRQTPRPAETAFELATERSQRAVDAEAPWFPQRNMGFTWISCDFIGCLLDFMGFSWHLLAFIGFYGILLAFNLFAFYCQKSYFIGYILLYIRFYGIWWILPGKVQSWTTKTWWFNQEETDSSRSTCRLNASKMGVVDDVICRWMIAIVKIPVH